LQITTVTRASNGNDPVIVHMSTANGNLRLNDVLARMHSNKTRKWFHLRKSDDEKMIIRTKDRYDRLSSEDRSKFREHIVSMPGGKPILKGHRLWIELVVHDFLSDENTYEIDDYSRGDLENICIVWFFETWMNSKDFQLEDYKDDGYDVPKLSD